MTNDLKKAGMNVKEVLPKEGVTGWSDSWMLSKNAKHPICAYKYMNYVTSPATQAKVADVTGYSPANTKTCAVVGAHAVQRPAHHATPTTTTRSSTGRRRCSRRTTGSGRTPGPTVKG